MYLELKKKCKHLLSTYYVMGDRKLTKSIDDYGNQLILQLFQKSTSTPYQ